jgi:hypothetical protein
LLYFVSGVCEQASDTPLLGMARFFTRPEPNGPDFPGVQRGRFILREPNCAVWSPTAMNAAAGMRSASTRHGDFDDDATTLESVMHVIKHGFIET